MATILEKKTTLAISEDEKCWLAFGNLALAEIANCIEKMGGEILNENTGEILELSDIKKAFYTIESLNDKDACWIKTSEWHPSPQEEEEEEDYEEPYYDECGFDPYMGCYTYDC